MNVLITGGAGFFGTILKQKLLDRGETVVSIDLQPDGEKHERLISVQGDINDHDLVESLFEKYRFAAVYHLAALLAHEVKDKNELWRSNVDGTKAIRDACIRHGVKHLVFTSSNCLWAEDVSDPVPETKEPNPIEIYGRSKWEGEKILLEQKEKLSSVIFRCPTIIDEGRLGLLALLFEFMDENRKIPMVGNGENKYQFIYAQDLADACIKGAQYDKADVFNIGSDNVKSFNEVYQYVINKAGSRSKLWHLPKALLVSGMKVCHFLRISPLGPYQYKMISSSFVFDTDKIKKALDWAPTLSNEEMLYRAYDYYRKNRKEIEQRKDVSAHKRGAKMGIIKILKHLC